MLEKPNLQDDRIANCLREQYRLSIAQVTFLPLGADQNTSVYRAVTDDGTPYFVKLRRGFDETSVLAPKFLHDHGIPQIIAPLATCAGPLWGKLDDYAVILYPFIEGRDGYAINMSDRQWVELGRAFKGIHTTSVPSGLASRIARETYSPRWREIVKGFQSSVETTVFADPIAAKLAELLQTQRDVISDLVLHAERCAAILQAHPRKFVLCHSDIHAGNVLITTDGVLYIVDWDAPIFAPKERDLMYAGGGQFMNWRAADEEERLFYQGYGPAEVDPVALAYYRLERIVEDIASYCEMIFLSDKGDQDRMAGLRQLSGNFEANGVATTLPESASRNSGSVVAKGKCYGGTT